MIWRKNLQYGVVAKVFPSLTLFEMGFFELSVIGGGGTNHKFVVIAPMIMQLGRDTKVDVFYTMVTKSL